MWAMSGLVLSFTPDQIHHYFMKAVVQKLRTLFFEQDWQTAFARAIDDVTRHEISTLLHIETLSDFLRFINEMVR